MSRLWCSRFHHRVPAGAYQKAPKYKQALVLPRSVCDALKLLFEWPNRFTHHTHLLHFKGRRSSKRLSQGQSRGCCFFVFTNKKLSSSYIRQVLLGCSTIPVCLQIPRDQTQASMNVQASSFGLTIERLDEGQKRFDTVFPWMLKLDSLCLSSCAAVERRARARRALLVTNSPCFAES